MVYFGNKIAILLALPHPSAPHEIFQYKTTTTNSQVKGKLTMEMGVGR